MVQDGFDLYAAQSYPWCSTYLWIEYDEQLGNSA